MNDRRRFDLRALILAYVAGYSLFVTGVCMAIFWTLSVLSKILIFALLVALMTMALYAALDALEREQTNRLARQESQTASKLMRTVPHLWRGNRVDECRIVGEEIECSGHDKSGRINLTRSN